MINANRVMDLRNGIEWNGTQKATFRFSLHPNLNMPNIRDTGIQIFAGYKTTFRAISLQLESDASVKELDIQKRRCRFGFENDDLEIFSAYSR